MLLENPQVVSKPTQSPYRLDTTHPLYKNLVFANYFENHNIYSATSGHQSTAGGIALRDGLHQTGTAIPSWSAPFSGTDIMNGAAFFSVRRVGTPAGYAKFVALDVAQEFQIYRNNAYDNIRIEISNASTRYISPSFPAGLTSWEDTSKWHHYAIYWKANGSRIRFYYNAGYDNGSDVAWGGAVLGSGSTELQVGNSSTGDRALESKIGYMLLFNKYFDPGSHRVNWASSVYKNPYQFLAPVNQPIYIQDAIAATGQPFGKRFGGVPHTHNKQLWRGQW